MASLIVRYNDGTSITWEFGNDQALARLPGNVFEAIVDAFGWGEIKGKDE